MVSVPDRNGPVFAATANATVPFPVPDAPDVIVMNGSDVCAVQAHAVSCAMTVTVAVPPLDRNGALVGSTLNVHETDACWTTVAVALPIVIVALRSAPGFTLTLNL